MDLFDKVRAQLPPGSQLPRWKATDIDALRQRYPGLPADYLQFLTEVGYGDLSAFQLHGGPSSAKSLHAVGSESLEGILVFGDDKQGYSFGFDTNDGFRVVEISPKGEVRKHFEQDFSSLMRAYLD